jgi:auxin efflux carrier family protein
MGLFSTPASYRRNVAVAGNDFSQPLSTNTFTTFALFAQKGNTHPSHPALGRLILLVFEAVMEVVCVSLPGYILARLGMFDADNQKFVANLNVALFTPSLSRFSMGLDE